MRRAVHTEVRAALRDDKRVSVAISDSSGTGGLRILIGAVAAQNLPKQLAQQDSQKTETRRSVSLTARERQILRLIAKGLHNRQIAARIHRSIKTVEKHRQNLHSKLSTHEVAGLTRHALELGLMDNPGPSPAKLVRKTKQLTPRELEILKLVAQGSGNKWIASELRRSIKTIDHHRENIMKKLGLHEVASLTRHAFSIGLL